MISDTACNVTSKRLLHFANNSSMVMSVLDAKQNVVVGGLDISCNIGRIRRTCDSRGRKCTGRHFVAALRFGLKPARTHSNAGHLGEGRCSWCSRFFDFS